MKILNYESIDYDSFNPDNYFGFIYIIENKVNSMLYIGKKQFKSTNGKKKYNWRDYLGSSDYLDEDIKAYGKQNFYKHIIKLCKDKSDLDSSETYFIMKHEAIKNNCFYNRSLGGDGGSLPGELNPNFGRKQTEEHRRNISEGTKNGYKKPFYVINIFTNKIKEYNNNIDYIDEVGCRSFYINNEKDLGKLKLSHNKTTLIIRKNIYYDGIIIDSMKQNNFLYLIDIETLDKEIYCQVKDIKLKTKSTIFRSLNNKRIIDKKYIIAYIKDCDNLTKTVNEYKESDYKFKYRNGIKVIDISTNELKIFIGPSKCAEYFNTSRARIIGQVKSGKIYKNKYIFEKMYK